MFSFSHTITMHYYMQYVKFEQLERFSTVVTHGIKHEYKWWPIVELGCRYIFVTSVVLSPGHVVSSGLYYSGMLCIFNT